MALRPVHLLLGIGGLAVIASTVLVVRAVQPLSESRHSDTVLGEAGGQVGPSVSTRPVTPLAAATGGAREADSARAPVTEDPCATLSTALDRERAARALAEQEVARLREELAEATRDLTALRFPESTPYGAFLASPEAREILENIRGGSHLYEALLDDLREDVRRYQLRMAEDPSQHNARLLEVLSSRLRHFSEDREAAVDHLLGDIQAELDSFPVMLRPGEATWLAEHLASGGVRDEELVYFLGPSRLAAEMSLDELFEDHLGDEDYGPRLQAALPPEKRAELDAKLHTLMEENSDDPEWVAWLLERFPTFFD